ncbi:MAG: hypothetical protein R3B47_14340 [Bacteroidia bacterium]
MQKEKNPAPRLQAIAESLSEIRSGIAGIKSAKARLALLDISSILEEIYFTEMAGWKAQNVAGITDKSHGTGMAAMGTGFIEEWEWDVLMLHLNLADRQELSIAELQLDISRARGLVNGAPACSMAITNPL